MWVEIEYSMEYSSGLFFSYSEFSGWSSQITVQGEL